MFIRIMRHIVVFFGAVMPVFVFANGNEGEESMMHQIEEMLPFEHLSHGHWFGGILSIILWAGLIYAIVMLVRGNKRGKDETPGGGMQQ